jgi:hypothetical protein
MPIIEMPQPLTSLLRAIKDGFLWACIAVQQFGLGWRVPVTLLRGPDRYSGREAVLLIAGRVAWTQYFTKRFFAGEPDVVRAEMVAVWRLRATLDAFQEAADMTLVAVDRISSRLFLKSEWLRVPIWVGSSLDVPADWKTMIKSHSKIAGDMRRVRNGHFKVETSRSEEDFELFYERFYLPTVHSRHGRNAHALSRSLLRWIFRKGMIQWCIREGEKLAGDVIFFPEPAHMAVVANGVLDGRAEWRQQGLLAALYCFSVELAWQLGCTRIFMGGSRPSLHDGVFRYKNKWSDALYRHVGLVSGQYDIRFRWKQLQGPVADFLSHTSLIHHDHDGFSALWFFPRHLPLTAENLAQQCKDLTAAGLRKFRILLPGPPPPGFDCPPHLQLIPLADAARLQSHELVEREIGGVIGAEAA